MAESLNIYKPFMRTLLNKEVDLDSDDIRVMLVGGAYTPDASAHAYKADVTGEITGTNYIAGGEAIPGKSFTITDGTGIFSADNVMWPALTADTDIRYGVIYDNTPATDDIKPLIAYIDFGEAIPVPNADFEVIWSTAGILRVTAV